LPYEDTKFIADIIEDVGFIDASAPHANHVLVSGDHELEPFHVLVISNSTTVGQSVHRMKTVAPTSSRSYLLGSS